MFEAELSNLQVVCAWCMGSFSFSFEYWLVYGMCVRYVCACVRARVCVHACVCVCMRACVCVCVCAETQSRLVARCP